MILREVDVKADEKGKRRAVLENIGNQVIIYDDHQKWGHCTILEDERGDRYRVIFEDGRGERLLHYHDLNRMLVIQNHPEYPRPKLVKR